ncbi:MAG: hypothetical protein Q7T80_00810 [Methanoregula sp.]|nr:hypothetical protein [Methanoregula sp.]
MPKQKIQKPARIKEEIVKITLWLPDQQALNQVLAMGKAGMGGRAPRREGDGTYQVDLYALPGEAKKILTLPYRHSVDETYGKVLAERRKEVSRIDRFKGGKVKPTGIGRKG